MPRKITTQVIKRKDEVYNFIKVHGEVPTAIIVRELGLSHSQVFYVLRLLAKEGRIEEVRRGKLAYWRVRT